MELKKRLQTLAFGLLLGASCCVYAGYQQDVEVTPEQFSAWYNQLPKEGQAQLNAAINHSPKGRPQSEGSSEGGFVAHMIGMAAMANLDKLPSAVKTYIVNPVVNNRKNIAIGAAGVAACLLAHEAYKHWPKSAAEKTKTQGEPKVQETGKTKSGITLKGALKGAAALGVVGAGCYFASQSPWVQGKVAALANTGVGQRVLGAAASFASKAQPMLQRAQQAAVAAVPAVAAFARNAAHAGVEFVKTHPIATAAGVGATAFAGSRLVASRSVAPKAPEGHEWALFGNNLSQEEQAFIKMPSESVSGEYVCFIARKVTEGQYGNSCGAFAIGTYVRPLKSGEQVPAGMIKLHCGSDFLVKVVHVFANLNEAVQKKNELVK